VLGFAQQEEKGRSEAYLGVLVAGEGPDEDLAKYDADRPSHRRQEMEREREVSDSNFKEEDEGWSLEWTANLLARLHSAWVGRE
jgi:hypothetical protein